MFLFAVSYVFVVITIFGSAAVGRAMSASATLHATLWERQQR